MATSPTVGDEMKYIEENARYNLQTRELLTKFLSSGALEHKFEPLQQSYINICYLNKTRRRVTQECWNKYTENLDYEEVDFKYQGHREKYGVAVRMPMLVTQNMRDKDVFNMQQFDTDNIEENKDGNLEFTLNGKTFSSVIVNFANPTYRHFVLQCTSIREEQ